MAKIPDWNSAPEIWDTIKLGDATLPGQCEITGGSIGVREDRVPVPGGKEEVSTLSYRAAEVEVVVQMWLQEHLDKFKEIVKLYRPRKDNERKPLTVLHPTLDIFDINYLYIVEMGLPVKIRTGLYEAKISLREFWEERTSTGVDETLTSSSTEVKTVESPATPAPTKEFAPGLPEAP